MVMMGLTFTGGSTLTEGHIPNLSCMYILNVLLNSKIGGYGFGMYALSTFILKTLGFGRPEKSY